MKRRKKMRKHAHSIDDMHYDDEFFDSYSDEFSPSAFDDEIMPKEENYKYRQ